MTGWTLLALILGALSTQCAHWLKSYLSRRAEDAAHHASYPARNSECVHTRLTEYRDHLIYDELARLVSVRERLDVIVAALEKNLPDSVEAQSLEKELMSVASEIRSLYSKLLGFSGLYEEGLRYELQSVAKRLKELVHATEDLASRVTEVEDEVYEEFLRESLQMLKSELEIFDRTLYALGAAVRDTATPQAIAARERKRLT